MSAFANYQRLLRLVGYAQGNVELIDTSCCLALTGSFVGFYGFFSFLTGLFLNSPNSMLQTQRSKLNSLI